MSTQLTNTAENINANVSIHDMLDLPPLPANANTLITQTLDEDVEFADLAGTLEKDPALSARLIGLAQSSYFGDRGNIYTVQDAIQRALGLEMVKCLALSISLTEQFILPTSHIFNLKVYWVNAVVAAETAKKIAPYLEDTSIEPQQAYLAGLLHNLGILALVQKFPEPMQRVYKIANNAPEWTYKSIEKEYLNIDHHQAGAILADRWHLPDDIIIAIKKCNDDEYQGEHSQLAQLINYCVRFTQNRLSTGGKHPVMAEPCLSLKFNEDVVPILDDYLENNHENILELAALLSGGI